MTTRHQNISLRGLRTFCVVAEHEGFRDAADKLFITASSGDRHQGRYERRNRGAASGTRGSVNTRLQVAAPGAERMTGRRKSTNLCVAYLKTGDYEGARSSCDRAVATIRNEIDTDRDMKRDWYKARMYRTFLAVALSNRGATRAVTGSPELARDDCTSAMKVDTDIREPEVNLARLSKDDSPSA
jgi:hypothetical protein